MEGYYVGGKTGTSEKVVDGRYSKTKLLTTFTAILPADKPRYLLLIMLDEPQGLPETHGYATSGWNAAPTAGKVIARIAPMLGIEPRFDLPPADQLILAKAPALSVGGSSLSCPAKAGHPVLAAIVVAVRVDAARGR